MWKFQGIASFGVPLFIWSFGDGEFVLPVFPEEEFGFSGYIKMGEKVWVSHGLVHVFEDLL